MIDFQTPLTTAGTVLIIDRIESQNYVTNVSGWAIKADGTAEFFNLISRGRFIGGTIGGQRIDINQFNTGTVQFYTGSASESTPGTIRSLDSSPFLALNIDGPQGVGGAGVATISLSTTANVTGSGKLELTADTLNLVAGAVALTGAAKEITSSETWHAMSLVNSWIQVGALVPQYRKDIAGNVWVQGIVSSGTTGTITTLPAGYRPQQRIDIALKSNNDAATMSWVQINTTGTINVVGNVAPAQVWCAINFSFTTK